MPPEVAEGALALDDLLTEADKYCRAGQHLLTLAAESDVTRYRQWYLQEFVRQVAGGPPLPWPAATA